MIKFTAMRPLEKLRNAKCAAMRPLEKLIIAKCVTMRPSEKTLRNDIMRSNAPIGKIKK